MANANANTNADANVDANFNLLKQILDGFNTGEDRVNFIKKQQQFTAGLTRDQLFEIFNAFEKDEHRYELITHFKNLFNSRSDIPLILKKFRNEKLKLEICKGLDKTAKEGSTKQIILQIINGFSMEHWKKEATIYYRTWFDDGYPASILDGYDDDDQRMAIVKALHYNKITVEEIIELAKRIADKVRIYWYYVNYVKTNLPLVFSQPYDDEVKYNILSSFEDKIKNDKDVFMLFQHFRSDEYRYLAIRLINSWYPPNSIPDDNFLKKFNDVEKKLKVVRLLNLGKMFQSVESLISLQREFERSKDRYIVLKKKIRDTYRIKPELIKSIDIKSKTYFLKACKLFCDECASMPIDLIEDVSNKVSPPVRAKLFLIYRDANNKIDDIKMPSILKQMESGMRARKFLEYFSYDNIDAFLREAGYNPANLSGEVEDITFYPPADPVFEEVVFAMDGVKIDRTKDIATIQTTVFKSGGNNNPMFGFSCSSTTINGITISSLPRTANGYVPIVYGDTIKYDMLRDTILSEPKIKRGSISFGNCDVVDSATAEIKEFVKNKLKGRIDMVKKSGPVVNSEWVDVDAKKKEDECAICYTNKKCILMDPCGHIALCCKCARELHERAECRGRRAKCPVCRTKITRMIKAFNV